jgi:hypothetical protein
MGALDAVQIHFAAISPQPADIGKAAYGYSN